MKVYLLFALVFLSAVNTQAPRSCFKNPYMKIREAYPNNKLIYLQTPFNTSTQPSLQGRCGKEWDTFGTCCDPWDLPSHVSYNEEFIFSSSMAIVKFYSTLAGVTNNLMTSLKKLALSSPVQWQPGINANIKFAQDFLNSGENLNYFDRYSNVATETAVNTFNTEMNKCWTDMKKLRVASICSTCSGRSEVYFKKDKGLLTDDVCKRSLNNCAKALQMTFEMIDMLVWLLKIHPELLSRAIQLKMESWFDKPKLLAAYNDITSGQFIKRLDDLIANRFADSALAVQFCEKFFDLAKLPFIYDLRYALFDNESDKSVNLWWASSEPIRLSDVKITSEMPAFEKKLASFLNNWKLSNPSPSSRTLQSEQSFQFFTSDVEFFPATDSIFTSYFAGPSDEAALPMNMSMCFP